MPTKQADTTDQSTVDTFTRMQMQAIQSLTGANTAWFEALSDMGSEVMTFLAERIQQDVDTQHKLLHCKNGHELQKIQAAFIQTALDQYSDETGKLLEMSQKAFDTQSAARGDGN